MMPDVWGGGSFNDGTFQANNTIWSRETQNLDSPHGEPYNSDRWLSRNDAGNNPMLQDWRDRTGRRDTADYLAHTNYRSSIASPYKESDQSADIRLLRDQIGKEIVEHTWRALFASTDAEFDQHFNSMVNTVNGLDANGIVMDFWVNEASIRKALEDETVKQLEAARAAAGGGNADTGADNADDDDSETDDEGE
jgi:multiple sugar transport system substrate-binding protein/putative aldouronate transport system substrate-binding protein